MKRTISATARRRSAPGSRRKAVEEYEIPEKLDREALWKVYMLHKSQCLLHCVPNPRTKNCRDNPYCLERLGSEKWEKLVQKMEKEGKTSEKSNSRREVTVMPCGLVNLGNSCYLNSFLQIFFSDPVFRRCIYEWRPVENFVKPEGEKINVEELMLCLQKLFVTLQITPYEDTSAQALADLLKLDDEQHDALEFQILLFEKMEKLLSYREEWKDVKNAIVNRFKGVITQTISCKKCDMARTSELPFNPLYLVIDKVKSLSKAIETLSDYKCECGHAGFAEKCLTVKEPPPVVTIQLNRFTFDAAGHKKKVQSALQYPRVLEICGVTYDICAVMIHEGPNADCGHYYDLIKHPVSKQWFTYNDAHVIPSVAPGVSTEKERISRVTPDMKGCYALIYRRRSEADEEVPEVPEHIMEMVALKLEEEFLAQTSATTESQQRWASVLKGHHERIKELWSALQVKDGASMMNRSEEIVFLPTKLLSEVQSKEFEAVAEKKDESEQREKKTKEDEEKDEKENGPVDLTVFYKMSAVGSSSYCLCSHGRISVESVQGGMIKAVNKDAAEELLKRYSVQVASSSGRSQQRVLNNGMDICLGCAEDLKREKEFAATVEAKEKLARQLLREKTKRYYHSDNCFWVSIRSLQQYRKLATRAREQRQGPAVDCTEITFAGLEVPDPELKSDVDMAVECKPSTSKMEQKADSDGEMAKQFNDFGLPDGSCKEKEDQEMECAATSQESGCTRAVARKSRASHEEVTPAVPNVSSAKKSNGRCVHRSVAVKKRRVEANVVALCEETTSKEINRTALIEGNEAGVCIAGASGNDVEGSSTSIPSDRTSRINGNTGAGDRSESPMSRRNSDICDKAGVSEDGDADECVELEGEMENGLDGDEVASLCSRPKSRSTRDDADDETSEYNDETDERKPVLFNGELKCVHGKFDYESSVVNERRIVVDTNEWRSLVEGIFDDGQLFALPTDQLPCSDCELIYNCKQTDREGRQRRIQEIRASIGELIRIISRRRSAPPIGEQIYSRVVCGTFIKNMLSMFKSGTTRNVSTPAICQECVLCDEHQLPCVPLSADGRAVPVTLEEWNKIRAALEHSEEDVVEIALSEGGYESFCQPCFERRRDEEDLQRFVFKAGEIYVKLKNDENEEPRKVNGGCELNGNDVVQLPVIGNTTHATTRRAIAKSCMRFRVCTFAAPLSFQFYIYIYICIHIHAYIL
ncbi:Ubiquitin carboxyl-terminal hydrolase 48 [Toxocara canis]|uniref:ubiquitinyl hydrolase 1 n=1 Tax=Toxocara canis TaxID=6265 RepID=A0A0B2UUJ2_TOXCA|nr:Ubiquitin carboxyl-terminal hydrolase 48 [Toxocara canis]